MDSSFVFMVFGLGFFLFVVYVIITSERETYRRTLNENREFGYREPPPKRNRRSLRDK